MISLIGTTVNKSRSGQYRVIVKGAPPYITFYPQVKGWFFWNACEYWGKSEMDCAFDSMEKALSCIESHKRDTQVERIPNRIVPVE